MTFALQLALLLQATTPNAEHFVVPMPSLGLCALPRTTIATHLSDLPADVRSALDGLFKEGLAEAGGHFNPVDYTIGSPPFPSRRFLRAYRHGGRWMVWYEHGGRGHHLHAVGVILRPGKHAPEMDSSARYTGLDGSQLCAASRAYFQGAMTSQEY